MKPADTNHPFGHGKAESIAAVVVDDVNAHNTSEVLSPLCANTDPQRACRAEARRRGDSIFIPQSGTRSRAAGCSTTPLVPPCGNSKLGIDATKKLPGEPRKLSGLYKSRTHRDRVNAKVMKDPRVASLCDPKNLPFDTKRMLYGGFKTIVEA